MLSRNLKQCKIGNWWFCTGSGGYMKHICTCQHQYCLQHWSDNERLRSLNPLLSLTPDNQSPNNDYNCYVYKEKLYDKSNCCYHEDYPLVDDDCSSQSSDDSLDQYYLIHNCRLEEPNRLPNNASPQSDAQNRFQGMLHDLILRHKASLQMFDDICHLVNEYTLSQEFSIHTKLQSRISFLRYMEGSHRHTYSGPQIVMSHCTMVKLYQYLCLTWKKCLSVFWLMNSYVECQLLGGLQCTHWRCW